MSELGAEPSSGLSTKTLVFPKTVDFTLDLLTDPPDHIIQDTAMSVVRQLYVCVKSDNYFEFGTVIGFDLRFGSGG